MALSKIQAYLQKAKIILLCPFTEPLKVIKIVLKFVFLIANLLCSLVKDLFNRIYPKIQIKSQNGSQNYEQKNEEQSFWQKFKSFNLSDLDDLMTTKIKSLQQNIPEFLAKWFPQRLKFDNSKLNQTDLKKLQKSSNQVLVDIRKIQINQNKSINQTRVYYVPTYLRVKVKNFTAIDLDKLQAEVNVDVIISFVYGNKGLITIPKEVAVRLLNEVVLNFERDDPLKLDQTDNVHISTKQQKEKYHIQFTVRKKLHMRIQSRVYYTPFQKLYLILPITIQQLTPKTVQTQQINKSTGEIKETCYEASIKFNYMDNQGHFIKLDFTDEKHFGYYSLIETGLDAKYSNKRITSIEELQEYNEKYHIKVDQRKGKKTSGSKAQDKAKNGNNSKAKIQPSSEQSQPLIQLASQNKKPSKKDKKKQKAAQQQDQIRPISNKPKEEKPKESKTQKQQLKYFQYSFFKIPIYKHPMASLVMIFLPLWSLAIINLGIFFQQNSLSERIASIASLMIAFIALNQTIRSQIPPHPRVVFVELLVYAEMIACFLCLVNSYEVSLIENYHIVWTECKIFLISLGIFVAQVVIILVMGLYHYYVMVPSYELSEKKPKFDKIDTKNWRNEECDKHFQKLIDQTQKVLQRHSGMTQSKKLKDINEQLKKKSQSPAEFANKDEIVRQVFELLAKSAKSNNSLKEQSK